MIKNGTVVSMTYRLTNAAGEELDKADKSDPFSYLHGVGQIVPGLEKALEGLAVGAKKQVNVAPADAYGEYDQSLETSVGKNAFPPDQTLEPGMRFAAEMENGDHIVYTITDVQGDQVTINGNHPLAGETLNFDVEILGIRPATPEEMQHGHAHGPDGHSHDH